MFLSILICLALGFFRRCIPKAWSWPQLSDRYEDWVTTSLRWSPLWGPSYSGPIEKVQRMHQSSSTSCCPVCCTLPSTPAFVLSARLASFFSYSLLFLHLCLFFSHHFIFVCLSQPNLLSPDLSVVIFFFSSSSSSCSTLFCSLLSHFFLFLLPTKEEHYQFSFVL